MSLFTYKDGWSVVKRELLSKRSHGRSDLLHLMAALELKIEPPVEPPSSPIPESTDDAPLGARDDSHPAHSRRVPGGRT